MRRSATRCRRRPTPPSRTATASARTRATSRGSAKRNADRACVDQRHRAVITFTYQLPYNITAGTVTQLASARPFNATTGIDNNGDGANNDRPVVNGEVISKSAFRGTRDAGRVGCSSRDASSCRSRRRCCCGWRASTSSTTATILGRAQTIYGDTATPNPTFGQLVARRHADQRASRRSRTSTRRGCSSCRCGSSSELRLVPTVVDVSSVIGLVTVGILTAQILLGLLVSVGYNPVRRWPRQRFKLFTLHNWLGYTGLAAATVHASILMLGANKAGGQLFRPVEFFFRSGRRCSRFPNTLGAIAFYLVAFVVVTWLFHQPVRAPELETAALHGVRCGRCVLHPRRVQCAFSANP